MNTFHKHASGVRSCNHIEFDCRSTPYIIASFAVLRGWSILSCTLARRWKLFAIQKESWRENQRLDVWKLGNRYIEELDETIGTKTQQSWNALLLFYCLPLLNLCRPHFHLCLLGAEERWPWQREDLYILSGKECWYQPGSGPLGIQGCQGVQGELNPRRDLLYHWSANPIRRLLFNLPGSAPCLMQ